MTSDAKSNASPKTASLRGAGGETRPSGSPLPSMRWHESWIIRAAGLSAFILFLGYASSAYFAFESVESIAKLAYDENVEAALGEHLDGLKRVHELQKALLLERLSPIIKDKTEGATGAEAVVRGWLKDAQVEEMASLDKIRVIPFTREAGDSAPRSGRVDAEWLDQARLRIGQMVAEFPRGAVYEAFKKGEDLKQRYQLIGIKLDENIRPTLIRATTVILVASFVLLVSLFFVYAQRFKKRIGEVIEGFVTWSERDQTFRFVDYLGRGGRLRYRGELKLITTQFNSMADEVEANRQRSLYLEKVASWQIIARKLAHEIKNPLTPIQMMVSQLKRRYTGDDAEFAKLLDNAQNIITEEVSGLRRMVDNFSQFARLPEPDPKPTDLVASLRRAVDLEQNRFPQHKITFDSSLPEAIAVVDDELLRQVVINLIKNAGEACGETKSDITVGLTEAGLDFVVTVKDNGPGIPDELKSRIFEAYFTTKHTGPNPGMGLGLAVCQKIVMDHAGRMTVKSKPGETVFSIRLPRRKKDNHGS